MGNFLWLEKVFVIDDIWEKNEIGRVGWDGYVWSREKREGFVELERSGQDDSGVIVLLIVRPPVVNVPGWATKH